MSMIEALEKELESMIATVKATGSDRVSGSIERRLFFGVYEWTVLIFADGKIAVRARNHNYDAAMCAANVQAREWMPHEKRLALILGVNQ